MRADELPGVDRFRQRHPAESYGERSGRAGIGWWLASHGGTGIPAWNRALHKSSEPLPVFAAGCPASVASRRSSSRSYRLIVARYDERAIPTPIDTTATCGR